MQNVHLVALLVIAITNQILCGPGELVPSELEVRSESVKKVDCSSPVAIIQALKSAVGLKNTVILQAPSLLQPELPAASLASVASSSVTSTCPCDTPFAYVLPFYPTVMMNWGGNVEGAMHIVAKMNPDASGTVFNVYRAVNVLGIVQFLKAYPQAQPVGLQLYAQAQQNPYVQNMKAQIQKLKLDGAPMKTRVGALMAQTACNTAVRQQIIMQSISTFTPGESIPETIRLNDTKDFGSDGEALLAGNIYASIGDMSDQHKDDPEAYYIYQQILQAVFPL